MRDYILANPHEKPIDIAKRFASSREYVWNLRSELGLTKKQEAPQIDASALQPPPTTSADPTPGLPAGLRFIRVHRAPDPPKPRARDNAPDGWTCTDCGANGQGEPPTDHACTTNQEANA